MNRIRINILSFLLLSFFSHTLLAQTQEITVIAPYQPTISDAYKINENPRVTDTLIEAPVFSYKINSFYIPFTTEVTQIEAAKLVGEPINKLYNNFLKIGFGNYITPYGEFFVHSLRSKKYSLGAHIRHFSSNGNIDDYAYQGFSHNMAEIYGKKFFNKYTLNGELSFNRDVVHYYGYRPADFTEDLLPSKKDIKQTRALIAAGVNFYSHNSDSAKLNQRYSLDYYYMFDNHSAREHHVNLIADINKGLKMFRISQRQILGATLDVDYYNTHTKGYIIGNSLIRFQPYISANFNIYHIMAGLNATVEAGDASLFHLYPVAEIKVDVVPSYLMIFGGVKGEMKKNSLKSLSDQNPFIISEIPLSFSNHKLDLYAGLQARLNNEISVNVKGSGIVLDNLPLFITDTMQVLKNKFTLVYDKGTMIRAGADISWSHFEQLHLMISAFYNYYDLENELKAWHRPMVDISLSADYHIKEKFIVRADFFSYISMYAQVYEGSTVKPEKLKNIFDGNIGFEYRYNKKLSAFINFNNIAAQRYYKWYNYPSQRFNILGGITFGF